ncbi:HupE/UreJ family protein [Hoeflea sp. TYP-13]|uniref:HupE/UreJ family protein n=1 Tax=Hoeflea sp. TYP-13 TaxID=3230023 RepID=UPI0034C5C0C7
MTGFCKTALVAVALVFATVAQAHDGHGLNAFHGGFVHPFIGLDHLLAMLAVGLWASTRPSSAAWQAPLVFVVMLAAGSILTAGGLTLPLVEPVILLSLMTLGLMMAAARRIPARLGNPIIGAFALFHGAAHGSEAAGAVPQALAGLLAASAVLHLAGGCGGRFLSKTAYGYAGSGLAIAAAGLALAVG